jgi:hypothetical protein
MPGGFTAIRSVLTGYLCNPSLTQNVPNQEVTMLLSSELEQKVFEVEYPLLDGKQKSCVLPLCIRLNCLIFAREGLDTIFLDFVCIVRHCTLVLS